MSVTNMSELIFTRELIKLLCRDTAEGNLLQQSASLYEQKGFNFGDPTRKIVYYLDDNLRNPAFLQATKDKLRDLNCDLVYDTCIRDARKRWFNNNPPRVDIVTADATVPMEPSDSSYLTEAQEFAQGCSFLQGLLEFHPTFTGKVFIVTSPAVEKRIPPEIRAGIVIRAYTPKDVTKAEDPFDRFVPLLSTIKELFPLIKTPFDRFKADSKKLPNLYRIARGAIIQTQGNVDAAREILQKRSNEYLQEIRSVDKEGMFGIPDDLPRGHKVQQVRLHILNRRINAIKEKLQEHLAERVTLKKDPSKITDMMNKIPWGIRCSQREGEDYEKAAVAVRAAQIDVSIELDKILLDYQQTAYGNTVNAVPGFKPLKSAPKLSPASFTTNYYRAIKTLLDNRLKLVDTEAVLGIVSPETLRDERKEVEFFKNCINDAIKQSQVAARTETSKVLAQMLK